ncbi:MAG: helix-turn-helix domain-containing protein [Lachnospiraceae bacterium]|nr:helix-turn-helix domain-containing protein [Lachnospiraceae bacterium]
MGNHRAPVLLPKQKDILKQMGYQIRMVRQRRRLTVNLVAERAGVSRQSVWAVEKGSPSVVMGTYVKVLHAVGFDKDLLKVCADDPLGRLLQDEQDDKYGKEEVEDRWS